MSDGIFSGRDARRLRDGEGRRPRVARERLNVDLYAFFPHRGDELEILRAEVHGRKYRTAIGRFREVADVELVDLRAGVDRFFRGGV